jgi:hypothetical protein
MTAQKEFVADVATRAPANFIRAGGFGLGLTSIDDCLQTWDHAYTGNVPLLAGVLSTIPNRGTLGGNIAQGTAGNQPSASTLNARRAGLFDGVDDYYASSLAAAQYKALHDGSVDNTVAFVCNCGAGAAQICWATASAAAMVGLYIDYVGSVGNKNFRFQLYNGSGTIQRLANSPANMLANNTTAVVVMRFTTADYEARVNGVVKASGYSSISGAPSAANPTQNLSCGFGLGGYLPEAGWWPRALSDREVKNLEFHLANKWGAVI